MDDAPTRHDISREAARRRRRFSTASIVALGIGWALIMQSLGWAQTSYYALVKSFGDGTAQIDRYHWETRDKSWTNGHFFSVKAPGLPMLVFPLYEVLHAVGAESVARTAADNARDSGARQWTYRGLNVSSYGFNAERAAQIKRRLEVQAPIVWALGLIGSVLPAIGILLLVRALADRLRPGLGTVTALSLGMSTMVFPFAVQFFGHILATLLAFGAFALLWRERESPGRLWLVALAGVLSGLAVTTEYPLAIAGAIVGVYGLLRADAIASGAGAVARRGVAYAAGVLAGIAPLLAYNLWAFGNVTTTGYANAVDFQGFTGHDTLGLNSAGFFGVSMPDLRVALELLIAPRGLLVITPIFALSIVGTVLLHRRGKRAEAWTIAAVALAFFVYVTGYWLPFGGGSPGPRFLIPALPFLAIGVVETWRRLPATTLALSACGFGVMFIATMTYPLIGTGSIWQWWERLERNEFQHTVLAILGGGNGWPTLLPLVAAFAAAIVFGALASGPLPVRRDLPLAVGAVAAWLIIALVISPDFGERKILGTSPTHKGAVDHTGLPWQVAVVGAGLAALLLAAAYWRERRDGRTAAAEPSRPDAVDDERAAPLPAQA